MATASHAIKKGETKKEKPKESISIVFYEGALVAQSRGIWSALHSGCSAFRCAPTARRSLRISHRICTLSLLLTPPQNRAWAKVGTERKNMQDWRSSSSAPGQSGKRLQSCSELMQR